MSGTERLLARGRDCDVYEHGPHQVLRRSRLGSSQQREADVLEHVRAHGYPVPAVHEVRDGGRELVLERVDGPSMLDDLGRRPWRLRRHAATLASLHEQLHAVPAPDWLPQAPFGGDRVLHLDLHPLNVLLGPRGPAVIDWQNAARGNGPEDVVTTWLILAAATVEGRLANRVVAALGRRLFLGAFLRRVDRDAAARLLPAGVAWRCADPNTRPEEAERMQRLARRVAPAAGDR